MHQNSYHLKQVSILQTLYIARNGRTISKLSYKHWWKLPNYHKYSKEMGKKHSLVQWCKLTQKCKNALRMLGSTLSIEHKEIQMKRTLPFFLRPIFVSGPSRMVTDLVQAPGILYLLKFWTYTANSLVMQSLARVYLHVPWKSYIFLSKVT